MTRKNEDDPKKFLKTPKVGDKVKVYPNVHNEECRFGTVNHIKKDEVGREIAVLNEVFEIIPLEDCDFCLEKRKVEFKTTLK